MTTATVTPITPSAEAQVASVKAFELSRTLANALLVAGLDDTLPVLRSVHMRFSAVGLTVSATDRYRLLRETVDAEVSREWSAIVDRDDVATIRTLAALARRKGSKDARAALTVRLERVAGPYLDVTVGEFSARLDLVVGQFPKLEQVLTDNPPEPVAQLHLNPRYLSDVGKLSPEHPGAPIVVSFGRPINHGDGTPNTKQVADARPMRADLGDRLTYLLMPVRVTK